MYVTCTVGIRWLSYSAWCVCCVQVLASTSHLMASGDIHATYAKYTPPDITYMVLIGVLVVRISRCIRIIPYGIRGYALHTCCVHTPDITPMVLIGVFVVRMGRCITHILTRIGALPVTTTYSVRALRLTHRSVSAYQHCLFTLP